ncbi:hypothetical protein MXB_2597 [Myxobolus squamalis]|nr:hypothetical protein MXB_2597 [Myxobolus squamalis]
MPIQFETLKKEELTEGSTVLGCVKNINEKSISIQLPDYRHGHIPIEELKNICKAIGTEHEHPCGFFVHKIVPCVVIGTQNSIRLSPNPEKVNSSITFNDIKIGDTLWGMVKGIEDHGFQIDFGLTVCGFVNTKKAHSLGELAFFTVKDIQKKLIQLDLFKIGTVGSSVLVGNTISCTVVDDNIHEATVRTKNGSRGYISPLHYDKITSKTINSVVLYVTDQRIGLSMRNIFNGKSEFMAGDFVEGKVIKCFTLGVIYSLNSTSFAFSSKYDTTKEPVKEGHIVKLRVKETSAVFGCLSVSNKPDLLSETLTCLEKLECGMIVSGIVNNVTSLGFQIRISSFIQGFIYKYLAENDKMRPGETIKCRVLYVAAEKNKVILTSNNILVESHYPILDNYPIDSILKCWYLGFVEKSQTSYLIVKFYNNVSGLLHKSQASLTQFDDLEKAFPKGSPIRVRIISSDPERKRLVLSTRDYVDSLEPSKSSPSSFVIKLTNPKIGESNVFDVITEDISTCLCKTIIVPDHHLSDFPEFVPFIKRILSEKSQSTIPSVFLGKDINIGSNIASLKHSVLRSAELGMYPNSFSDINVGMYIPGFVIKISSVGLQVMIGFNVVGFLPSCYIISPKTIGQSLLVLVKEIDHSKNRIILTLQKEKNTLECQVASHLHGSGLLFSYLKQFETITKIFDSRSVLLRGRTLSFKIINKKKNSYDAEISGIPATIFVPDNTELELNTTISAACVHWDLEPLHIYSAITDKSSVCNRNTSVLIVKNFDRFSLGFTNDEKPRFVYIISNQVISDDNKFSFSQYSVIDCTIQSSFGDLGVAIPTSFKHLMINSHLVSCAITKIYPIYLKVKLNLKSAFIHISNSANSFKDGDKPFENFKIGDVIEARTISKKARYHVSLFEHTTRKFELSLRSNLKDIRSHQELKVGSSVLGFVVSHSERRIFIEINSRIKGFINIIDLKPLDEIMHDPLLRFTPGTAIDLIILDIDQKSNIYKFGRTHPSAINIGQAITGRVSNLNHYHGVYVDLPNLNSGFIHITNFFAKFIDRPFDSFHVGTYVQCKVLSKLKDNHFSLSIKHLFNENCPEICNTQLLSFESMYSAYVIKISPKSIHLCLSDTVKAKINLKHVLITLGKGWNKKIKPLTVLPVMLQKIVNEHLVYVFPYLSSYDSHSLMSGIPSINPESVLKVGNGFDWQTGEFNDLKDNKPEIKNNQIVLEKMSTEKPQKSLTEIDIRNIETKLASNKLFPSSQEDFDRLIVTSPNSSIAWIGYISYYLQSLELDKARIISERALKTICYRETQEIHNIWFSIVNMECMYGTKESFEDAYSRARSFCNKKKIAKHVIDLYQALNQHENAEKECLLLVKFYSQSKTVYITYAKFLALSKRFIEMKQLLRKALQNLPQRKHIQTIVQFSLLEFKHGDPQRGSTLIESILNNFPNRIDIWFVYIDQLVKISYIDKARCCFEKVSSLPLKKSKAITVFNKFIKFEEKHGDSNSIAAIHTRISQLS